MVVASAVTWDGSELSSNGRYQGCDKDCDDSRYQRLSSDLQGQARLSFVDSRADG